jgi:hypothetical protein
MNEEIPETLETPEPLTKKTVDRNDLLTMNPYDVWALRDWSAHASAKFADLLSLPAWEVIKKHGL